MDEDAPEHGVLLRGEENVAVRIKVEREARAWSTNALSDRMNDAGYEMNPSAVWRIENGKRRINVDEAIGFADVFGISLENLVGPPRLATRARAMELIDAVVTAHRESQRATVEFVKAREAFDAYIAQHPDIREEADAMVNNAIAEQVMQHQQETYGFLPGAAPDAESPSAGPDA